MPQSRRAKALDFTPAVKAKIWERDGECCVLCGRWVPVSCANAHFVAQSQNGLGIEQNGLTLCPDDHHKYDNSDQRKIIRPKLWAHLKRHYPGLKETDLCYHKYPFKEVTHV